VLTEAAKKGLPGDHHFFITYDTHAPGVRMSPRLREQYPKDITIVLQHQFWDLSVGEELFEVGLAFNGVPERLVVPFAAIHGFFDPSVQFGLQFEPVTAGETAEEVSEDGAEEAKTAKPRKPSRATSPRKGAGETSVPAPLPAAPAKASKLESGRKEAAAEESEQPAKPTAGAEVVRLDRFRKK
jgi:hypothetical protein